MASKSTSPWVSLQNVNATAAGRRKLSSTSVDAIYCKRISCHVGRQVAGKSDVTPPVQRALLDRKTESDPCVSVGGRGSGSEPCLPGVGEPMLVKFKKLNGES